MTFGNQVSETDATTIIKSAMNLGINFIDTSDHYAKGRSEEILGKALKAERHSIVLATKVYNRMGPGVNDIGLSRKHIMQALEDSLRRLGTDYTDIYYAHSPDYNTPIEETLRAMDDLVHQGKVRYIGYANCRAWQLCKALCVSSLYNLTGFDCVQTPYNLVTRDNEYELLSFCSTEGVGVTVYNPLAGGILTGKYDLDKEPKSGRFTLEHLGSMYRDRYWLASNFEAVEHFKEIAHSHGRNLPQFSLAWILSNKTITSVVSGVTTIKQLEENLGATELELSEEEFVACDHVWQQLRPTVFLYGR